MSNRRSRPPTGRRKIRLQLTRRAIDDLRQLEAYSIKIWGRRTAAEYLDEIQAALDRIASQPGLLAAEPTFSSRLFFYRVRKHQLVCDVDGDVVTLLTVFHTSMDLSGRLAELEPRLLEEVQLLGKQLTKRPGRR